MRYQPDAPAATIASFVSELGGEWEPGGLSRIKQQGFIIQGRSARNRTDGAPTPLHGNCISIIPASPTAMLALSGLGLRVTKTAVPSPD